MKSSQLFFPTLREVPSEAEVISHQLLLRAGFIRKSSGGMYTYMPLAVRVLRKIQDIVRHEMDAAGAQEVLMPIVQPKELWEKSGRWSAYGDEMFRLKDRHGREFSLGPTHEEVVTDLVDGDAHSYRDLPMTLYQIQNKYRDEIRPRFGLMRGREFIMKDAYSFDMDKEGLDVSYEKMRKAYCNIFDRMSLKYRMVDADSGAIGGNNSNEFMVLAESGEDTIIYCDNCDYGANLEKAVCPETAADAPKAEALPLEKIPTPGVKTVKELSDLLGHPENEQIKTLIYLADEELVCVLLRGDHELNEIKLKNLLGCELLVMAAENDVRAALGAGFGSLGPVGNPLKIYADFAVKPLANAGCGANEDGFHFINVNPGRDFTVDVYADLRNAVVGDACPHCGHPVGAMRGVEVGHIFKLGTKYSQSMNATYLDPNGKAQYVVMGCYGIGVSRTMAAAVEQNNDEHGIIWPMPIAPYQVIVVPVNAKKADQMEAAEKLYEEMTAAGLEVLLDDRDERAGVKFKDADLIGIPIRVNVGPKGLAVGEVELKLRTAEEAEMVALTEITAKVKAIVDEQMKR